MIYDVNFLQEKYEALKEDITRINKEQGHYGDTSGITGQNHPSVVEV